MTVVTLQPEESAFEKLYGIGLLTFPGFLKAEEIARLRAAAEHVRDRFYDYVEADNLPHLRDRSCMRQLDEPLWHTGDQTHRLTLLEFGADARFVGAVEQCFQGPSTYCSSSLFMHPREKSIDGVWHRDSQFIYQGDEEKVAAHVRDEVMAVQFQVALYETEDIEYVPFSPTRYDSPEEYRVRVEDGRKHAAEEVPYSVRIHQRPGDAVLFNPNGMHRGRYHTDKPRLTIMYTYTPYGKIQFNEFTYQPWMSDPTYLDGLSPRARAYYGEHIEFYRNFWETEKREPILRL